MPKPNLKESSFSGSCDSSVQAANKTKKAKKSSPLRVGIPRPLSAVFCATEAPNNAFSDHALDAANQRRLELLEDGSSLKQDWLDADHWRALAAQRDYRLPHWYLPLTAKGMERVLRDLGLCQKEFRDFFGRISYKRFMELNSRMPLWAFAGQCLEVSIRVSS